MAKNFIRKFFSKNAVVDKTPAEKLIELHGDKSYFVNNALAGLVNPVDGTGTSSDFNYYNERADAGYTSYQEMIALYRTNFLAKRIIDTPASDMTRKWRKFIYDDPEVLEKRDWAEKKYRVQEVVRRAIQWGDLFGGSAIILGVDDSRDISEPLELRNIDRGDLKLLNVVYKEQINISSSVELDPYSDNYGLPEYYTIAGADVNSTRIHGSRVIPFFGSDLPLWASLKEAAWGDSRLRAAKSIIEICEKTWMNIAQLLTSANVDLIKIPGFEELASPAGKSVLSNILSSQQAAVSNYRKLIMGTEWEYSRHPISGLGDLGNLLEKYLHMAASAGNMTVAKLFGESVKGFGEGDNEKSDYYDSLSERLNIIAPNVERLDKIIERSLFGEIKNIKYEWNPFHETTEHQRADLELKQAQRDDINLRNGIINTYIAASELRASNTYNAVTEEWVEELKNTIDDSDVLDDLFLDEK